jgi:hypothetical protein
MSIRWLLYKICKELNSKICKICHAEATGQLDLLRGWVSCAPTYPRAAISVKIFSQAIDRDGGRDRI